MSFFNKLSSLISKKKSKEPKTPTIQAKPTPPSQTKPKTPSTPPAKQSIKPPPPPSTSKFQERAKQIILNAQEQAFNIRQKANEELWETRKKISQLEERLSQRETLLEQKSARLEQKEKDILAKQNQANSYLSQIENLKKQHLEKLEKLASLTKEEAKKLILEKIEKRLSKEIAQKIKQAKETAKELANKKAKEILVDAMRHGATDYVAEYSVSSVKLPNEEIKGRIIGREGRNIRSLEKATGVDFDLDESPDEIRLSCFDPIRREIAKTALKRLIIDGRIQPSRIEEFVAKAKQDIEKIIFEEGEKLCHAVGVYNLPKDKIHLLGRFKYRSSYGQNMISHTLEETKIGIKLAQEVGADVDTVRLGCLLHDIGKVINEEGSHVELGVKLLEKNNMPQAVIDCVAQHHEDTPFTSIESIIVYIADAISGSRPGARFEDYEQYITRLKKLEDISKSFKGVREAYTIQAGREVRVIVSPEELSDDDIIILADKIKNRIEKEIKQKPGQVKVTVIREKRANATAN